MRDLIYSKAINFMNLLMKFAKNEKLLATLERLQVSEEIKDLVLNTPLENQGFALGLLARNPQLSLLQLKEELEKILAKQEKIKQLKQQNKEQLPKSIPDKYKDWFSIQIRKNPEIKDTLFQRANELIKFVEEYDQQISSFVGEQLLAQIDAEKNIDQSDVGIFFSKVKELERDKIVQIGDERLKNWARKNFLLCRKEWVNKINKYLSEKQTTFQQILREHQALADAHAQGELRGQDLQHSPLHHSEHALLLRNLEFYEDWVETVPELNLSNLSIKDVDLQSNLFHQRAAEEGLGLKYEPIQKSNIVFGPEGWQDPENNGYFILELKSENDLKVEGFKMQHCVGGYWRQVEAARCRIFSLRHIQNIYQPILTVETDASGAIIRQDYGFHNRRIEEKFHEMINEWSENNFKNIDLSKLTRWDRDQLARKARQINTQKLLMQLINTDLNSDIEAFIEDAKITLVEFSKNENLHQEIEFELLKFKNKEINQNIALKTKSPEIQKSLYRYYNEYLARNDYLIPELKQKMLSTINYATDIAIDKTAELPNNVQNLLIDKLSKSKISRNTLNIFTSLAKHPSLTSDNQKKLIDMFLQIQSEIQSNFKSRYRLNSLFDSMLANPNRTKEVELFILNHITSDPSLSLRHLIPFFKHFESQYEFFKLIKADKRYGQYYVRSLAENKNLAPEIAYEMIELFPDNKEILTVLAAFNKNQEIQNKILDICLNSLPDSNQFLSAIIYFLSRNMVAS